MKYLLAAEADRIQDLLFRSSELREVVGGSQLLKRFCEDVPRLLGAALGIQVDVITAGGGSFYLAFDSESDAKRFGAALAEAYYRATGGTLSVAYKPEPFATDSQYVAASRKISAQLRAAKQRGTAIATAQMPYTAICESCGLGLAVAHEARVIKSESQDGLQDEVQTTEGHYLCASCRAKAAEREQKGPQGLLGPFYDVVVNKEKEIGRRMAWPKTAEDIGSFDPRNYVAYLVADGNGLGEIFGNCSGQAAVKALSESMEATLRESMAEPIKTLLKNQQTDQRVPAMPMILGGDDLFALVPAPWSLDIAGRLCQVFQERIASTAANLKLSDPITMTVAVVICKASYPYYLAHEVGEARLSEAKRVVKAFVDEQQKASARTGQAVEPYSAVDFEVILGEEIEPGTKPGNYRQTLRPYWVHGQSGVLPAWGRSLADLLCLRKELARMPSGRRAELRALFDQVPADLTGQVERQWDKALDSLLARVERGQIPDDPSPLRQALERLGGLHLDTWQLIDRTSDPAGKAWHGHGMADLLRVWPWALRLDLNPQDYEGGDE